MSRLSNFPDVETVTAALKLMMSEEDWKWVVAPPMMDIDTWHRVISRMRASGFGTVGNFYLTVERIVGRPPSPSYLIKIEKAAKRIRRPRARRARQGA